MSVCCTQILLIRSHALQLESDSAQRKGGPGVSVQVCIPPDRGGMGVKVHAHCRLKVKVQEGDWSQKSFKEAAR